MSALEIFGWDIGGANIKACRMRQGEVLDAAQWPCPLWQGLDALTHALQLAAERWPGLNQSRHAVTMTGEMVDLFSHRQEGVERIAVHLAQTLAPSANLWFFAGDDGWCTQAEASRRWASIASANWLAAARHVALQSTGGCGVLVDIGSTTTDLIAFGGGRVLSRGRSDVERLASGELVYHGVVRTPLCALAPRIEWRGRPHNVMNEFFATAADVYRLTGELDPAHDGHPPADGAGKDAAATHQRLARMIGLDARDAAADEWQAFAKAWRAAQVAVIGSQLDRVLSLHGLGRGTRMVAAGCGDFLLPDIVAGLGRPLELATYAGHVARLAAGRPELERWVQVCAPCVAVAALFEREQR